MGLVGYDPLTPGANLTTADRSAAGAVSSALTRLLCQPLDVAKIRLQLQVETGNAAKYRSLFHLMTSLPREEGVLSLWKGHLPAQYLSISYGVSTFAVFEVLTKLFYSSWTNDPLLKPATHLVCGGLAGCAATLVSFPFDTIRTRLVAQPEPRVYKNTKDAAVKLFAEGGLSSFYRGLVPTLAAIAPYSGLQFGFYTLFTQLMTSLTVGGVLQQKSGEGRVSMPMSLSCGGLAGMCAKTLVYPLDTVKKRLQVGGWSSGRRWMGTTPDYAGVRGCARDILSREGWRGFFKGYVPGVVKAVTTTSLHFWLYECVCYGIVVTYRS